MVNSCESIILIAAEIKYQKVFSKFVPNMKHLALMFQIRNRMAVSYTVFFGFRRF